MNLAPRFRARLGAGAALVPASLVAVLASLLLGGQAGPGSTPPADQTAAGFARGPDHASTAGRVLLRVPNGSATVTLDDSSAARAFAAMLPLRLTLHDPLGQTKSGQLPSSIDVSDAEPESDPSAGELYYWAPSHTVAIFYDDLGHSVPPPGLVRLGVVGSGLASIETAGTGFAVRVERADRTVACR